MQIRTVALLLAGSLMLIGCNAAKQSNTPETNALPNSVQEPLAEQAAIVEPEKIRKPRRAKLAPTDPTMQSLTTIEGSLTNTQPTVAVETHNAWQPNEAHLARGSELIMGLQRDIGRQPSRTEMQNRLQTHMGLSSLQAQKLISALGMG